jgi:hypothetical protein
MAYGAPAISVSKSYKIGFSSYLRPEDLRKLASALDEAATQGYSLTKIEPRYRHGDQRDPGKYQDGWEALFSGS